MALSAPDKSTGDRERKQRVQDTVEMLRGVIAALEKNPERQEQDLPDLFPVQKRPVPEEIVAPPIFRLARCKECSGFAAAMNKREHVVHEGIDRVSLQDEVFDKPRRDHGKGNQEKDQAPSDRLQLFSR